MTESKLRWGIIGCADIAIRTVIPGLQKSTVGEVYAIASRSSEKASRIAEQLGIPKAYGTYESLLCDPEVDAVYIPLPNHLHKEWTIRAAQTGKHILCEKPIALNTMEAQEMVDACQAAGVNLAEAYMYRYHPRYDRIREIIESCEIGVIRGITGSFTVNIPGNRDNIRFNRETGGGSMYDVGCYPISAARLILGTEPEAVMAYGLLSPQHDYVDMMVSGLVEFPNDVALTFDCGMSAAFRNKLEIIGTDGRIEVPNAFVGDPRFMVVTSNGERVETFPELNPYTLQADSFGRTVLNSEPLCFEPIDAVKNMRVIEACLKSIQSRQRVLV